ncbi:MAG: class aminotransferase [Chitinophagaceae bacterium]|nr:class aminotransferase [Chitinophagaceae bacterium]
MVSFYPGPSRLDLQLEHYLQDALRSDILSQNHRSDAFMKLYEDTRNAACRYLNVPADYSLYFLSSATECWEILSQDLGSLQNLHLYNGAFGEKGFTVNRSLHPDTANGLLFDKEELPDVKKYDAEVIHLTQNETANGTQLPLQWMQELRKLNPSAFITVDATSSMAGQLLPIEAADVWFASVQKCFGMPSGMAVMFCSPRVAAYGKKNKSPFYNSIHNLEVLFNKKQTTHTPNVLGIYLLNKILTHRKSLSVIHQTLKEQSLQWYKLLEQHTLFKPLIAHHTMRSDTVIAAKGEATDIERFKKYCAQQNYIIGNGYGDYATDTFRIANFPSHQPDEIAFLKQLLTSFQ